MFLSIPTQIIRIHRNTMFILDLTDTILLQDLTHITTIKSRFMEIWTYPQVKNNRVMHLNFTRFIA